MATPYDPRKLTPELRAALTPYEAYRTSKHVRDLVERAASPSAEALVCLAWLEWNDAMATEFDEDVIQWGGTALAALVKARELAPKHAGAIKLERQIERRMKSAARSIKKVEKLVSVDEEKLTLEDAGELAFVILNNPHSSPGLLQKAHRLAMRLVREHPDVTPGSPPYKEFYGHTFYHLGQAAEALWRAGDHEAARPLLWKLIDWPVVRDAVQYDHLISDSLQFLMVEAMDQDAPAELGRLLLVLKARFAALHTKATISLEISERLHAYAVGRLDADVLGFLK